MNGAEIEAKLAPCISGKTLILDLSNGLGSTALNALLTGFFGGRLEATLGAPQPDDTSVTYPGSSLATEGFALYETEPLSASLAFSAPAGAIEMAVTVTLPSSFGLADSFGALRISKSELAAVAFATAGYRLDSTLPAGSVEFSATVDPTKGPFAPLSWLFEGQPQVSGEIVPVKLGSAEANFTGQLAGDLVQSPKLGEFGLATGIRLVSAPLAADKSGATIVQLVEAIADFEAGELSFPIAITPDPGETAFTVVLDPLRPPLPALSGFEQLKHLSGEKEPGAMLTENVAVKTPIGALSLDWLSFTLDTEARQVLNVQVTVHLGTKWEVVDDLFKLEGLTAAFTVPNPLAVSAQPPSVLVTAEFEVGKVGAGGGMLDVFVQYPAEIVGLTLAEGSQIDIDAFLGELAAGAKLPGSGDLSIVELEAVADIGQSSYSLSAEAEGKLEVIKYFVLDELSFSLEYASKELQSFVFGCRFEIAKVELALNASYTAGNGSSGNWVLEGGTYQQAQIDLTALAEDLGKMFDVQLPASRPDVKLSTLRLAPYETATGNFTFEAAVSVFTEDPFFKEIEAQLKVSRTAGVLPPWSGDVKGTLTIGTSELTLEYDFQKDQMVRLSWQASGAEALPVGPLIEKLSGGSVAIGTSPDLGLRTVSATYDVTNGELLLGAVSAHYGDAALWSEVLKNGSRLYAFGVNVPLDVTLADIPLVGDKIPGADQLGIAAIGAWLLSGPLTKKEAETVNAKVAPFGQQAPHLPAAEVSEPVILTGSLKLGAETVPLSVPIGGGTQSKPAPPPGSPPVAGDLAAGSAPAAVPAPPPADNTRWFVIQRSFGVFYVDRIGVAYASEANTLGIALDASVQLGPLTFTTQGLEVSSPLTEFKPKFTMSGLGVSYVQPPLEIAGSLLAIPANQLDPETAYQYDGVAVVKAEQFSLAAIASYAQEKSGDPSLFVFAQLEIPLGGPPEFFVTGLMAGFGYNRSLELPTQDEVMGFPLLVLGAPPSPGTPAAKQDPAHVLAILEGREPITPNGEKKKWIAARTGSYWIAVGLTATSYEIVETRAMLVAEFGERLVFALLGTSTLSLPQEVPAAETYAYVELALEVVLEPEQGIFEMAAVVTPNSYVIAPACHLTGGFAFCIWFGSNPHAGQFVMTLGGYHPAFSPPSYFPAEPRLGFNWAVSSEVTVKGGAYFALTTSCVMAGGGLEVSYASGDLEASYTAQADMLISWHPFFFTAEIGVSIHVSFRLDLGFINKRLSVSASASVSLTGPPTGGKVKVHLAFITVTVEFGAHPTGAASKALVWGEFSALLPAQGDVCKVTATEGVTAMPGDPQAPPREPRKLWIVRAGAFAFATEAAIPSTALAYGTSEGSPKPVSTGWSLAIRPMDVASATSTHTVTIRRLDDDAWLDVSEWEPGKRARAVAESLWGAPLKDRNGNFTQVPQQASAETIPGAPVGAQLQAPAPELGAAVGPVAVGELYEPVSKQGEAAFYAQAPLSTNPGAATDFAAGFDPTSLEQVAGIGAEAGQKPRTGICIVLGEIGVYEGPNEAMTAMTAGVNSIFADAPLLVAA